MNIFTEGVFTALAKMLGGSKFRKEMRKIEKMTQEDPGLQAELDNFAYSHNKLKKELEDYCEKNPDSFLCNKSKGKKSRVTNVKY